MVRQSTGNATCPATYHTNSPISTILGCDSLHSGTHYCRMQLDSFGCRHSFFLYFSLVFSHHRKPLKMEEKRSMIVVIGWWIYAQILAYRGSSGTPLTPWSTGDSPLTRLNIFLVLDCDLLSWIDTNNNRHKFNIKHTLTFSARPIHTRFDNVKR